MSYENGIAWSTLDHWLWRYVFACCKGHTDLAKQNKKKMVTLVNSKIKRKHIIRIYWYHNKSFFRDWNKIHIGDFCIRSVCILQKVTFERVYRVILLTGLIGLKESV